jgi:hypothetical protein
MVSLIMIRPAQRSNAPDSFREYTSPFEIGTLVYSGGIIAL